MYSKKQFQKVFDKSYPILMRWLEIPRRKVKIDFQKKYSKENIKRRCIDSKGWSLQKGKIHRIVFVYDNHSNDKDCLDTIVHELLHVLIGDLGHMPQFINKNYKEDERVVMVLTRLIMDFIDD